MNEEVTIRALIEESFRKYKNLPAIASAGKAALSYGELEEKVYNLASDLLIRGISKGDKIAILADNSPTWVIAYLSTVVLGAVAVPILTGFPEADIHHIIRNSESVALFVGDKYRAALEGMESNHLHSVYSIEDFSLEERGKIKGGTAQNIRKKLTRKDLTLKEKKEIADQLSRPEEKDLAAIIYTSGTTGSSKGVMLTHKNIASNVINSIKKFPIDSNDRFLSILPLAHTFEATGGMLCPLTAGVNIFYLEGLPTPQKLLAAMESVQPTGVLTVPLVVDKIYRKRILPKIQASPMLRTMYRLPAFRKYINRKAGAKMIESFGGRLRFFMFGGASLNPDVETYLRDASISYSTGYGMTETAPILTINPFGKVKFGSCGQPIPGIDITIDGPDPMTGIGEIMVKGSNVMKGYYKNEAATRAILQKDGWLHTGDLGYFDGEGYLFIKGRSKNVIVGPSGENIYPEIIEQQLLLSPYIQQVIVYEKKGKIIAKAYPDYDTITSEFSDQKREEEYKRYLGENSQRDQ